MKFLIVGDLHGNKPNIHYKEFDAIIAPGDFCSDASKKYMFQALRERLQNPDSKIRWYDLVGKKEARKMVRKSLKDGRSVLEKLNSYDVPVYVVPGNWDWVKEDKKWGFLKENHFKKLIEGLSNVVDVYHRIVDVDGYQIIGHGISSGPEYPQYKEELERLKPNELQKKKRGYEKDSEKVASLFEKAVKPVIFLSHNVPFKTTLDEITSKESPRYGYHYGSLIAREMIDEYHPLVCIGGHMHEHFGKCKVGKTTVVNAGYGSDVNILMELVGNRIKLKFYS